MTHEILLRDEFGLRLTDGSEAYRFRVSRIDPYLASCDQVVLDFTGVRSANSSFVNALVSGLFEQHGAQTLGKLVFRGCQRFRCWCSQPSISESSSMRSG